MSNSNPAPAQTPIYERPIYGQAVTSIISNDIKTPRLKVKFCNVIHPFYYPNSPLIPRYSITVLVNPDQHALFIAQIEKIEAREKIKDSTTFKTDTMRDKELNMIQSGNFLMKFQTREKIPVIVCKPGFPQIPAELKSEITYGDEVEIVFDIIKYTKRGVSTGMNKGVSYQPKLIYLYPFEINMNESPSVHDQLDEAPF